MAQVSDKHKDKLSKILRNEITNLFQLALDYAEVACGSKEIYKALRSKILRVGNDCIRNVERELQHFDVKYIPTTEDVIQVCHVNKKEKV